MPILKHIAACVTAVFCLTPCFTASADESALSDDTTITWHQFQAPPLMILKGPHKDSGIIDGLRGLLKTNITDFKHADIQLPYKRFLLYAKRQMNVCTPYLFKNKEREKYLVFSNPAVVFPGFEVIMHRDTYAALHFPPYVSIKDLFENRHLRLATNKVRSYNKEIDPIIAAHNDSGLISRHSGSTTLVFRLIVAKRADFMIDFPNRLQYWTTELGVNIKDYISLPIAEEDRVALSYVACPKTPWGEKVITAVNKTLQEKKYAPEYLEILQRWASDFHKSEIERLYRQILLLQS